ncbi:hypothetical protein DMB42_23435 [Nonomuraea sp. WAC 01424]|nr:hypothetical protein DMB42_23435 [Nonomuraea sp. WAC 01424]
MSDGDPDLALPGIDAPLGHGAEIGGARPGERDLGGGRAGPADGGIGAGGGGRPRVGHDGALGSLGPGHGSGCDGAPNNRPERHQSQPE